MSGFNEQIFGADKHLSGRFAKRPISVRPTAMQSGKGRTNYPLPLCKLAPACQMVGALSRRAKRHVTDTICSLCVNLLGLVASHVRSPTRHADQLCRI